MLDTSLQFILDSTDHDPASAIDAVPDNDAALLDAYSQSVARIAETVGPAVVRVDTRRKSARSGGTGSGFVISPDGLIVTNAHVVNGFKDIRLADADGRTTDAQLIGVDPDTDVALIRANAARDLPTARLGDSKAVRRGQLVVAIGNPLGFEFDRDRRRRLRPRPVDPRHHGPDDRGRDPDRRRAQPRQFRRAAGLVAGRGRSASTPRSSRMPRASASRSPRTRRASSCRS